ncbi:alpha/beta fold hydrolase [Arthrobacter sp. H14-L1]|uniref:alpha/beta fold hydrolase n=1 Tax=Arthrobacter sp. H14-L1 TaxID=2996697 RepID=UPI00226F5D2F|nr:alpha/beta fold hydrolase [Arthrobacter sp. H14-L1]MCY0905492.1 alpha/beta fold hydrolase [Arthrobacter sp. H14-L1]
MVAEPWPGVDPAWSRFIDVPSTAAVDPAGSSHRWHLLDNGPQLAARGAEPAGTLLCVHGNPTWAYLWRRMLAAASVADRPWRVVAVDQLEMGFSARTGVFRRLEDRITDLGDVTAELGITGPVITVGHDWGGIISLGWATRHRSQLAAVVLNNTAVHPAGFTVPAPLQLALHPLVHRWGTTTTAAFLRMTHALAHPALAKDVKAAFMAPYRTAARRQGVGNFVADIPAAPSHPSWATLAEVSEGIRALDVPALLLWGPKDPVFSDQYLRDLLDRLPQADVHRFEGAGHLLPEDRDVATPILGWLDQNLHGDQQGNQHGNLHAGNVRSPGHPESSPPAAPFRPMLAELDGRRADSSAAVVDMAPLGGRPGAGPRTLSWAELAERVDHLAAGLRSIGVRPSDRVSLLVPPGIELTSLIYACLRLGAVVVVADAGLGTAGMSRAIKGAGPAFLIGIERALLGARLYGWPGIRISATELSAAKRRLLGVAHTVPELLAGGSAAAAWVESAEVASARVASAGVESAGVESARSEPAETDPDAAAAVLFTSGSTGPAKGVVYTQRQLSAMRDTLKNTYNLHAGTALVAGFAPFALLGPALGATSVTPDMDVTAPATLTAAALADAAAAVQATAVFASPAALVNVLATAPELTAGQRRSLAHVTLLLSAGAPIPEPLLAQVQKLVPDATLHTPYGMTEALPVTDISLAEIRAAGPGNGVCVGTAVFGSEVAITVLQASGTVSDEVTAAPDITGEIIVRGAHVKDRYDRLWITQEHSASVPGWHRTGDVGHLDSVGRLWVEGRLGHILTTAAGIRTPVAAEQRAETVDSVKRAAVVGIGPAGAQVAVAVIETVPRAKTSALASAELARHVRDAVSSDAAVSSGAAVSSDGAGSGLDLAAVLVVPAVPTDIRHNSKVDRTALAAWAGTALAGGRMRTP